MMKEASLLNEIWHWAAEAATYLLNRLWSSSINGVPLLKFQGESTKLHLNRLRVFGCRALVKLPKELRKMTNQVVVEAVFLGYTVGVKGYRVLIPSMNRVMIVHNVTFDEVTYSQVDQSV